MPADFVIRDESPVKKIDDTIYEVSVVAVLAISGYYLTGTVLKATVFGILGYGIGKTGGSGYVRSYRVIDYMDGGREYYVVNRYNSKDAAERWGTPDEHCVIDTKRDRARTYPAFGH